MEKRVRAGLLIFWVVFGNVVVDGKGSFGRCPQVQVPILDTGDFLGLWSVMLQTETGEENSCPSYEFEEHSDGTNIIITKRLESRDQVNINVGAIVKDGGVYQLIWPDAGRKSGVFIMYDEDTMGVFFCNSTGVLRQQSAYLLSKTGLVTHQAFAEFVDSVISFELDADDFETLSRESCRRILVRSMANEPTQPTRRTFDRWTTVPTHVVEHEADMRSEKASQ